jgi:hypothetical protein
MNSLRYSRGRFLAGSVLGWIAYVLINAVFRLPQGTLLRVLAVAERAVRALVGNGPAARAVNDLHFIFSRGGESAAILRRLITRSRPEEIVAFVRGAAIRGMP